MISEEFKQTIRMVQATVEEPALRDKTSEIGQLIEYMINRKKELFEVALSPEERKLVSKQWMVDCLKKADELDLDNRHFIIAYVHLMVKTIGPMASFIRSVMGD